MIRRFWIAMASVPLLIGGVAFAAPPSTAAPVHQALPPVDLRISTTLRYGSQGDEVRILQQALSNAGWPTWVDGEFGPHTESTVEMYQRANGLIVDGIAGPQTLGHLGIWRSGSAASPAPASPALDAPSTPSLAVGRCSQWTPLAAQVGWPTSTLEWLSGIMWRESGCNPNAHNTVGNDDSYSLLQINTKGALWGELQWRCGLTYKDQLLDPATNLACGYKLYLAYGTKPWRVG